MSINLPYPSASQQLISEIEKEKLQLKTFNTLAECSRVLKKINSYGLTSSRMDIIIHNLKNNRLFEYPVKEKIFKYIKI